MDRKLTLLLTPVLALALSGAALVDDQAKRDQSGSSDRNTNAPMRGDGVSAQPGGSDQQAQAPEGFILVNERLVYVLANEPMLHMTSALANLAKNDQRAAAEEVRIAANYVEMQGGRGRGEASQKLTSSADKLRKLADKIESGELKDADKLSTSFAKANLELARHHNALARSFLQNDRFVAAGYELDAAATGLKQAVVWSGQQPQQELITLIGNADRVASELTRESIGQQMTEDEDAQTAGARQQPQQGQSPILGTSAAEAKNVAEHARKISDELSTQIDQLASKVGDKKQGQQVGDDKQDHQQR